jgi:tRNA (cmo5U34)-methyltransferase
MMNSWTFDTPEIANTFDAHVREQLPWYDMVTDAVVYIASNYMTKGCVITEVGSSTGNMTKALLPIFNERDGNHYQAIEVSKEMCEVFNKNIQHPLVTCHEADILDITDGDMDELDRSNVTILFLTLMFIPVNEREDLMRMLIGNSHKGGCIIVVDKVLDHGGYFATVLKRLTMHFKLQQGAKPEDVLNKEMSLAGVQIPIDPAILGADAKQFFRMGEFAGWVIEC